MTDEIRRVPRRGATRAPEGWAGIIGRYALCALLVAAAVVLVFGVTWASGGAFWAVTAAIVGGSVLMYAAALIGLSGKVAGL